MRTYVKPTIRVRKLHLESAILQDSSAISITINSNNDTPIQSGDTGYEEAAKKSWSFDQDIWSDEEE